MSCAVADELYYADGNSAVRMAELHSTAGISLRKNALELLAGQLSVLAEGAQSAASTSGEPTVTR